MPEKKEAEDPVFVAVSEVHAAMKDLTPEQRGRVITAISAVLELGSAPSSQQQQKFGTPGSGSQQRAVSLVEVMQEKLPGTVPQKIALFAYYREKHEGITRFQRDDLKPYFSKAKEKPPSNFDRDFVEAVKRGWIHEEKDQSYITSKGIEAVEAGFPGQMKRKPSSKKRVPNKTKARAAKRAAH